MLLFAIQLSIGLGQNALDHYEAALSFEDNGQYEEAIRELDRVIEMDSTFERAYINRAIDNSIIGDLEGAVVDLTTIIELDENNIEPYVWRAENKRNLWQFESAMDDVEKALALKAPIYDGTNIIGPKEFDFQKVFPEGDNMNIELEFVMFERAAANYHLGNFKQALSDIKFCEQEQSEPINTHYYKGLILIELNRDDEACRELKKALESGQSFARDAFVEFCE